MGKIRLRSYQEKWRKTEQQKIMKLELKILTMMIEKNWEKLSNKEVRTEGVNDNDLVSIIRTKVPLCGHAASTSTTTSCPALRLPILPTGITTVWVLPVTLVLILPGTTVVLPRLLVGPRVDGWRCSWWLLRGALGLSRLVLALVKIDYVPKVTVWRIWPVGV